MVSKLAATLAKCLCGGQGVSVVYILAIGSSKYF